MADEANQDPVPAVPDHGQAEVKAKIDEIAEKGYHGIDDDPLKPDGYTLAGSVARAQASQL